MSTPTGPYYQTVDLEKARTIANGEAGRIRHLVDIYDRTWSLYTGFGYPGQWVGFAQAYSAGASAYTFYLPLDWPDECRWMRVACMGSGSAVVLVTAPDDSVGCEFTFTDTLADPYAMTTETTTAADPFFGAAGAMGAKHGKHLYDSTVDLANAPAFRTITIQVTPDADSPFLLHGLGFYPTFLVNV